MIKPALNIFASRWAVLLIILISLLMHLKVFNKDLVGFHVWRQTQTQTTVLNFATEDFNILNPRTNDRGDGDGIFRMEFPLPQWLISIPVRFLGRDVLISRIMNFIFGAISIVGIFFLVKYLFRSRLLGIMAAWILTFIPVFYYYSVNPMPDNLALGLSIWGLLFLFKWNREKKLSSFVWSVLLFSLSGLCKLPFALIFILPLLILLNNHFEGKSGKKEFLKAGIILFLGALPVIAWYIWVIPEWEGNGIVSGIFDMNEEQKKEFWYYLLYNMRTNMPELVIGFFSLPLLLYGVIKSKKLWEKSRILSISFLIWLALISGLILFEMNMIETVHDYYFMPFLPIVVLLSIYGLDRLLFVINKKTVFWIPVAILFLSMPVYSFFRIDPRWERIGFNRDLLTYKEQLRAAVPDSALVCAGNDMSHNIFLYYINKKGWAFEQNWMGRQKLEGLIERGCEYLYCDSRHVDQNPEIEEVFGTKVAAFGDINIFKLRVPNQEDQLLKRK